jgi:hypothetical protein
MTPDGPFTQVAVDGNTICGHVTTGLNRDVDLLGSGEIWAIYVASMYPCEMSPR